MSISESGILPDLFLACMGSSAKEMTRTLTEMQLAFHHDSARALHTCSCLSRYSSRKKNCSGFTVTLQPCSLSSRVFPVPKIDSLTGRQFESVPLKDSE
jgi:hypothetical protein